MGCRKRASSDSGWPCSSWASALSRSPRSCPRSRNGTRYTHAQIDSPEAGIVLTLGGWDDALLAKDGAAFIGWTTNLWLLGCLISRARRKPRAALVLATLTATCALVGIASVYNDYWVAQVFAGAWVWVAGCLSIAFAVVGWAVQELRSRDRAILPPDRRPARSAVANGTSWIDSSNVEDPRDARVAAASAQGPMTRALTCGSSGSWRIGTGTCKGSSDSRWDVAEPSMSPARQTYRTRSRSASDVLSMSPRWPRRRLTSPHPAHREVVGSNRTTTRRAAYRSASYGLPGRWYEPERPRTSGTRGDVVIALGELGPSPSRVPPSPSIVRSSPWTVPSSPSTVLASPQTVPESVPASGRRFGADGMGYRIR
jgi:hypothetical protein